MQKVILEMVEYLCDTVGQLQRPSDCALGFLTSIRKVMAPDLVGIILTSTRE